MAWYSKPTNTTWLYGGINKEQCQIEIPHDSLNLKESPDCSSLTDFNTIGSYNWYPESDSKNPIILIPGHYCFLSDNLRLQKLSKSKHLCMADENRHYLPEYPMEPIFRAVRKCTPDFDFKKVDFVTDRNGLRKLLNFIENKAKDSFRIDFQRVGNLILLIRNTENTTEMCDDYGRKFYDTFIQ